MKLTVVFCMVAALASAASAEVAYSTVESGMGYSSWPMIQSLGDRLVCVYIRGTAHSIVQGVRDAYAKWSADGGRTWSQPVAVSASPEYGETSIGKGLDKDGAALFWVRAYGGKRRKTVKNFEEPNFSAICNFSIATRSIVHVRQIWYNLRQ